MIDIFGGGAFNFLLLRKLRQLLQGGLENPWDGSMGFFPVENGDFPRGKLAAVRIWKEIFNEKKGFMIFLEIWNEVFQCVQWNILVAKKLCIFHGQSWIYISLAPGHDLALAKTNSAERAVGQLICLHYAKL